MAGDAPVQLHINTPLIESYELSRQVGCSVFLKLENTQPSGTFKIRGIGHQIVKEKAKGCTRIVASSGGNAGLAAAYAARKLGIPITIFVPESTPQFAVERLRGEGATVIVHGAVWDRANERALQESEQPGVAYIHPFDHPDIWEGHSTVIKEVQQQLTEQPDLVVLSVGGGGLLCGIMQGLETVGWHDTPVLTMETIGANCFNAAIKAGKVVTTPDITSVAKCLGSLTVAERAYEYYKQRCIYSELIDDKQCISACVRFLDDHKMLVEPACGAALAAVYSGVIKRLHEEGKLKQQLRTIVMIVCGGIAVNLAQLETWKAQVGLE